MRIDTTSAVGTHVSAAAPTSVYQYYDAAAVLLYVGVTSRGTVRNREHWTTKEWWPFVASQEVDHYDTRTAALDRERELIVTHRPPFNKQHNPDHQRLQTIYRAFADAYEPPTNESCLDLYRRLNRKVTLRPAPERGAPPADAWFATLPEQFELAHMMVLPTVKDPTIRDGKNRSIGKVLEVVHGKGLVSFLRVQINGDAWPPLTATATVRMDVKQRQVRITSIEVI